MTSLKERSMQIIIEKKHFYMLSVFIILIGGILFVQAQSSGVSHSADQIVVKWKGKDVNLGQALTELANPPKLGVWVAPDNAVVKQLPVGKYLVFVEGITKDAGNGDSYTIKIWAHGKVGGKDQKLKAAYIPNSEALYSVQVDNHPDGTPAFFGTFDMNIDQATTDIQIESSSLRRIGRVYYFKVA